MKNIEITDIKTASFAQFCKELANSVVIIADKHVSKLYSPDLIKFLASHGVKTHLLTFKARERKKSEKIVKTLLKKLFSLKLGKKTAIMALGGGITTDLAGFIASIYCRGISLINVPTSLLAMVDASIGGKNGINTPYGKNLIGTIYSPKRILIDPKFLKTLPLIDLKNGLVEMVKHALIADSSYLTFLEENVDNILKMNLEVITKAIKRSVEIKSSIVEEDPFETGKRKLLNFGHTLGHAIEKASRYKIPHGKAVALGILCASYLSYKMNYLDQASLDRIVRLIKQMGLKVSIKNLFTEKLIKAMSFDKKASRNRPCFVLLEGIGHPKDFSGKYCTEVEKSLLAESIEWVKNALCMY